MIENQTLKNLKKVSTVLISGGSGLVGRYLTNTLLSEGYKVSHLSRKSNYSDNIRVFQWDPGKGILEPNAFDGVEYLIHLSGANIGEKRWTRKRKEEMVKSRIESVRLLHKVVSENNIRLKAFISASAIGYYGSATSDKIYKESDPPSGDFLGMTCRLWEEGADLFGNSGIRTVKIRTAVVLEKSDSALTKLMLPAKFGFLVQTGNGRQYMPWIHIRDLCNIYLKAMEDQNMNGPYNAVSPQHLNHKEFVRTLAQVMNKPVFPIPIPSFVLKAALGEMSVVVLEGSRVSSERIVNAGYNFLYNDAGEALKNIINK